jgi:YrhK-like protein
MQVKTKHGRMNALRAFLVEYEWLHIMIGVAGNVLFVVGSTMFIWEALKPYSIACFLAGSTGMLIGNVGGVVVRLRRHRVR